MPSDGSDRRVAARGPVVDSMTVRIVAASRLVVAIVVAAVASFLPHVEGQRATVFFLIDLGWVPWATVVLFASEGSGTRLARVGGPVGDLLVLATTQTLLSRAGLPAIDAAILPAYLVVVVFAVYTVERAVAVGIGAAAIALPAMAQSLIPGDHRLGAAMLAPYAVAVVVLLLLIERTALLQTRAVSRYTLLSTKSDTILARVPSAILVSDAGGGILQSNPAVSPIVGRPEESVIGRSCVEVLGLHLGERRLDCSQGCALLSPDLAAEALVGIEVWRVGPSGERQPLLANAIQIDGAGGKVEVVHSIRDITRLKQAEEAKTLFLATASHELKTPLTVIAGFADTLAHYDDLDSGLRDAALDAIRTRAAELSRIVDRLLLSSRIEAGRIQLSLEEFDVRPVVTSRAEALAAATGREIVARVGAVPPVLANEEALVTVVDHLLDNAVKYSPGGDPVEVSAVEESECVRIEVADHGIGMDSEQEAHCFDKFWQGESTDVRRFGGTGIGLFIVRSLVEAMEGTASVHSARGIGTCFTVRLPRPRSPEPVEGPPLGEGEATSIREFMRQIGVPERGSR